MRISDWSSDVCSSDLFKEGIERGVGNAILVKVNQIGTFTETLEAIAMADAANYAAVISHRSGETADTTTAPITMTSTVTQIKTGPTSRCGRLPKSNPPSPIDQSLCHVVTYGVRADLVSLTHSRTPPSPALTR